MRTLLYIDNKGRVWWIDESHPETDEKCVVCRAVEHGILRHTAVMSRSDLKTYLLTDLINGTVNQGQRLNDTVEPANTKA
jgi:hypothetical protein